MGAYYMATNVDKNKMISYEDLKLAEHSYIGSPYMIMVSRMLAGIKVMDLPDWSDCRLSWLCDYHEDKNDEKLQWEFVKMDHSIGSKYKDLIREDELFRLSESVNEDIRYIMNLDKNVYIDMVFVSDNYVADKNSPMWSNIHPLPILTNSEYYNSGGGDYRLLEDEGRRGSWHKDRISVGSKPHEGFEDVSSKCLFYEED